MPTPVSAGTSPTAGARGARTPLSSEEIRSALARAHERATGAAAPARFLDVLTAHVGHETANGERMFGFNFGGIKGAAPDGGTAAFRTKEVLGGVETRIVDHFRVYGSVDAGADDYLALLRARYGDALQRAGDGDPRGFAQALAKRGYFTAPVEQYARALERHMGASFVPSRARAGASLEAPHVAAAPPPSAAVPPTGLAEDGDLPTALQVARVEMAICELGARVGSPDRDDSDRSAHGWRAAR